MQLQPVFFRFAIAPAACLAVVTMAFDASANPGTTPHDLLTPICGHCLASHSNVSQGSATPRVADFQIATRWSRTATNNDFNQTGPRGNPIDLTWGFAADGSTIFSTRDSEETGPSSLVQFFDSLHDPDATGGQDLTQRKWFGYFNDAFERLDELSGVSYTYEPNDDAAPLQFRRPGILGTRADVRIGAHSIDGSVSPSTVAYNYFPDTADMVLDIDNASIFRSTFNNALQLRNVIMHEAGHGLGLDHLESDNSNHLMEPFLALSFDGPQFDDLLALHRNYGDAREKNGGNDLPQSADFLGKPQLDELIQLGTDASDTTRINPDQTDFVSIDGLSDADVFRFTVTDPTALLNATLTPKGPTYNEGPQNDDDPDTPDTPQSPLVTHALSDLVLELLDDQGNLVLRVDQTIAGQAESLLATPLTAGDWFLRVSGKSDAVQMYGLSLRLVPEPALAGAVATLALLTSRRRRQVPVCQP